MHPTMDLPLLHWFWVYAVCLLCSRYISSHFRQHCRYPCDFIKGLWEKDGYRGKGGFASAIGSISFLLCFIGIVFFSIYIMLITYTPAQLTNLGRTLDQTVESQTGMSTESIFGTSYEDIMEQISSLKAPQ